jgi:hypothetical protein
MYPCIYVSVCLLLGLSMYISMCLCAAVSMPVCLCVYVSTVRHRGMGTGISEASKRVPIFSFTTQGGKQVSSYF